jgi:hypothetical protein
LNGHDQSRSPGSEVHGRRDQPTGSANPDHRFAHQLRYRSHRTHEANRIVVTDIGTKCLDMVVDAISEVVRIPVEPIEPAPDRVTGVDTEYAAVSALLRNPNSRHGGCSALIAGRWRSAISICESAERSDTSGGTTRMGKSSSWAACLQIVRPERIVHTKNRRSRVSRRIARDVDLRRARRCDQVFDDVGI